jgi:HAE1 family hydrophobic/amphiphilic exporter-1
MPSDLVAALNAQNAQVSAGQLGALPAVENQQLNATITARTKLKTVEEFESIVLKSTTDGAVVAIKDVARVELGPDNAHHQIQTQRHARRGHGRGAGRWGQCHGRGRCGGGQAGRAEAVFPQRD